jgi:SAM-dependent methyltransferase
MGEQQQFGAIRMPAELSGKRVLHLGCDEGLFCFEAKRRGANYVLGIDRAAQRITAARRHAAEAGLDVEFRHGDLGLLPEGDFDLILLFSELHDVADPADLLARVRRLLSGEGTLILELGVAKGAGTGVVRALGGQDERIYPMMPLLRDVWLRGYSFRLVGPGMDQPGEPITGRVYHCKRERTSVVMIQGPGNIGKSSLARRLGPAPIVSTDRLLRPVRIPGAKVHPAQAILDAALVENRSLAAAWSKLRDNAEVRPYCAAMIAEAIRHCRGTGLVIVEGHVLGDLRAEVEAMLGPEFRCWKTVRE